MKLPDLPEPDVEFVTRHRDAFISYDKEHMLQFQRDTVEACCQVLLESGFKSNGVPAYEHLVDKLRNMK